MHSFGMRATSYWAMYGLWQVSRVHSAGLSCRQFAAAYRQYVAAIFRGGCVAAHASGGILDSGILCGA